MAFRSFALPGFWKYYHSLPANVQALADAKFALFEKDPFHPSLALKQKGEVWTGMSAGRTASLPTVKVTSFIGFGSALMRLTTTCCLDSGKGLRRTTQTGWAIDGQMVAVGSAISPSAGANRSGLLLRAKVSFRLVRLEADNPIMVGNDPQDHLSCAKPSASFPSGAKNSVRSATPRALVRR